MFINLTSVVSVTLTSIYNKLNRSCIILINVLGEVLAVTLTSGLWIHCFKLTIASLMSLLTVKYD